MQFVFVHSILPSCLSTSLNPLVVSSIHCFHNSFWFSFSAGVSDEWSISSSFNFLAYFFTASICHSHTLPLMIFTPYAAHSIPSRYACAGLTLFLLTILVASSSIIIVLGSSLWHKQIATELPQGIMNQSYPCHSFSSKVAVQESVVPLFISISVGCSKTASITILLKSIYFSSAGNI